MTDTSILLPSGSVVQLTAPLPPRLEPPAPSSAVVIPVPGTPGPPPEPQAIAAAVADYLTVNPVLPSQAGQAGNVLSTDGADPSWMDITPPVTLTLLLDNALV
ncbi:hypothetical protein PP713_14130 [Mycobacterium sp. CSUR Q5927]|nr:hypothetical protein [Mycobacterium sp. CSUR Q5927]